MAVHYKFKSARDFDSVHFDGHFISVGNLKEKIFESKHLGKGTDFDLVVSNAQTNEEYLDEGTLIPKNTSVLIRRVPGRPRMPIVTAPVTENDKPKVENRPEDVQSAKTSFMGADLSVTKYPEDSEWDEFGNDLYAIPEVVPIPSQNLVQDAPPPPSKDDEDSKIKALIDTPALDWQHQTFDGFGPGRGFGRGMGGRMIGGRGFGRSGLERKTPPPGYVCHRCKVPGHFIQHCPTNGDPNYDIKRVKPPTGIPKSMLMATPDGSYALPSGVVAVLKPNEAAFEKEIEGLPSTRSVGDLPPELHCPLCKEVMKDAVLTSKCCFKSFCDRCIRDYIISKSMCVCGAISILADDLLPNKTLRDTINRIMESNNSSAENGGSAFQVQDVESRIPQPKIPSPATSVASKGEQAPILQKEENERMQETAERATDVVAPQQTVEKGSATKVGDASEATHMSMSLKEPAASQGSALLADEEVQQKPISSEAGKKKKKKKARLPLSASDMQWKASQDLGAESYMMSMGPSAYNPYWNGMQPMVDGYVAPYTGVMPYMGYGMGPMDVPFGGILSQDPFIPQGCMLPFGPPQRDLTNFGMGFNAAPPPVMSREEFEARKTVLTRKWETEKRKERELSKNREFVREMCSGSDMTSMKTKSVHKSIPQTSSADHHPNRHHRSERSPDHHARGLDMPRPSSKRKSDYDSHQYTDYPDEHHQSERHHHHRDHHRSESPSAPGQVVASDLPLKSSASTAVMDKKHKASVFSRISFPEGDAAGASKKRKLSSSAEVGSHSHRPTVDGFHQEGYNRKSSGAAMAVDYESSDDDRHFKRRPSRYEASPPAAAVASAVDWEEHRKGSRERERDRGRGGYSSKLRQ